MSLPLARQPIARLTRSRRAWVLIAGWAVLAIVSAIVVRARGQTSGADHVLRGGFTRFMFPLLTFAVVGAIVGGAGMRKSIRGMVGLGAKPRSAALATALVAAAACAVTGAVLFAAVCVAAHGPADPPLGADVLASTWIGALGGAAYGAFFSAGASIGRGGAGRGVFLAADFLIGGSAGAGAFFTPRGHVLSLVGGPLCAELSQRASSVVLVLIVLASLGLVAALSRRSA